jgi:hypothetical protein
MPSVKHIINTSLGQSSAESCWYAAYSMLYDWKGKPISSIREKIEKNKLDYADYWRKGLPVEDYWKTRISLGLSGFRRPYFYGLADDLDYFGKVLKDYGPFWCAFSSPSEHVVVVNGIDLGMSKILVVNPWGSGGMAEQEYYKAGEFQRRLGKSDVASAAQMFNE